LPPARLPAPLQTSQDILEAGEVRTDASGNPILKDVGPWMKSEMKRHFKDCDVKYIDPS
jgi:6-phosphofructokinase 1